MRPLTEGKLQAGSVCRRRERANKKKKEKTAKYIEASALPVRNGAGKVGEKEHRKQPLQRAVRKGERHYRNAVASARNSTRAFEYKVAFLTAA